jgi:hypothetical protein
MGYAEVLDRIDNCCRSYSHDDRVPPRVSRINSKGGYPWEFCDNGDANQQ